MKNLQLLLLLLCCNLIFAHTINYENQVLRHWFIKKENKFVDGSFSMIKDGKVYIEDAQNQILNFPISSLSKADQDYSNKKQNRIIAINTNSINSNSIESKPIYYYKIGLIFLVLLLIFSLLYKYSDKKKMKYLAPILFSGMTITLFSFAKKAFTITDPVFINSAFAPFATTISTSYDANYFYVNSKGVPNHEMMVGISSHGWQQQVPIPQCYTNTNHWSIPLNPVLATTPVPVSATHFLKGAIAIAANGIAIFNYHTNTGVDSYTDGQLDIYGGHCGRGDDYHYHTAPLHLIALGQTTYDLPIAFALDGYAVYGTLEPSGAVMTTLDANHGHYGTNGVYHYHGTATAPYMIGNMVGQVTEDTNLQIIPQAQSQPIRTENWTPLGGALITSCTVNATNNGYNTLYTLNGTSGYATNFSWSGTTYTFKYITPTGTTTTTYTGFSQCTVPNLSTEIFIATEKKITIFPNPATDILQIDLGNNALESDVQNISILDFKGSLVSKINKFTPSLDIKNLSKGVYFVKIQFYNSVVTKKILVK
jgi:hypothetical protein